MDVLGIPTVLVPPNPGNVSAFGLLTVDVKNDYVQTHVALADQLDAAEVAAMYDELSVRAGDALTKEGFPLDEHRFARTADLRYFGQAFEVRVPVPEGPVDAAALSAVADAVPRRPTRASTATTSPTTPPSRSSGSTSGSPASGRSSDPRSGRNRWSRCEERRRRASKPPAPGRSASTPPSGTPTPRCTGGRTCRPAR